MTHQPSNNTFQLQYILCFTIAPHLVLKPTSYPLNRATSDSAPKRGQICQQLIHHAQYQLISKHKQSIFDIRESWTRGAWQRKCTYSHYSPASVCCPLSPPPDWQDLVESLASCNYFTSEAQHWQSPRPHDRVRFSLMTPLLVLTCNPLSLLAQWKNLTVAVIQIRRS